MNELTTIIEMLIACKEHSAVRFAKGNKELLARAIDSMVYDYGYARDPLEFFVNRALQNYEVPIMA